MLYDLTSFSGTLILMKAVIFTSYVLYVQGTVCTVLRFYRPKLCLVHAKKCTQNVIYL